MIYSCSLGYFGVLISLIFSTWYTIWWWPAEMAVRKSWRDTELLIFVGALVWGATWAALNVKLDESMSIAVAIEQEENERRKIERDWWLNRVMNGVDDGRVGGRYWMYWLICEKNNSDQLLTADFAMIKLYQLTLIDIDIWLMHMSSSYLLFYYLFGWGREEVASNLLFTYHHC